MGDLMTIGIFGGTFNPIHHGHLNLCLELKERCGLKEVWLIPACVSPFRLGEEMASAEHRLQMCKLATEGIEGIKVLDMEVKRGGASYTVETVKELEGLFPLERFHLLLGEDAALSLPRWKDPLTLLKIAPPLVGCRKGIELRKKIKNPLVPQEIRQAIQKGIVESNLLDIEARELRQRFKNKLYCNHLMPLVVMDYIRKNAVY